MDSTPHFPRQHDLWNLKARFTFKKDDHIHNFRKTGEFSQIRNFTRHLTTTLQPWAVYSTTATTSTAAPPPSAQGPAERPRPAQARWGSGRRRPHLPRRCHQVPPAGPPCTNPRRTGRAGLGAAPPPRSPRGPRRSRCGRGAAGRRGRRNTV